MALVLLRYVALALNCWVRPRATEAGDGVTAIDCSGEAVTVRVVLPIEVSLAALMTEEPTATAVARPVAAFMVATLVVTLVHVELLVMSEGPSV